MVSVYEHRVQYYETDKMGVVHHSNYIRWFEEARSAFLEEFGLSYRKMEEMGIVIPIVSVEADYKSMTHYWDLVGIETRITRYNGIRADISYVVRDMESGEVRCTGASSQCFMDSKGNLISLKKSYPEIHGIWEKMAAASAD